MTDSFGVNDWLCFTLLMIHKPGQKEKLKKGWKEWKWKIKGNKTTRKEAKH